ncbi:hypothetical protein F0562_027781 [Nyssa sinensis]|uniref:AT-hook motif nuclear-localized protein n=1 Tax=Nyssa sinensis TaxID=561372 RepID=A0A5J5B4P9_9ASTE|nr:hypothetical protein F0562_027781 [Nyssa sinensis]
MKGEYGEEKDHSSTMFAKLHQTQQFQQQQPLHPHQTHHHFQVTRECQTSEEADSRSPGGATPTATHNNGDGASIEVVRRPRGRPPGSKNKPKPPVIITRDTQPSMSPYVLELPGGVDIVDAISCFCRKRNMGLCVLSGSGTVANVTLKQPSSTPGATVTFHGRFDILSLSATILPTSTQSILPPLANGFTISLAGPQGQIVGGCVVGSLLAAGTVYVIAASFNNPSYLRLPAEDDVHNSVPGGCDQGHSPPEVPCGGDSGHPPHHHHPTDEFGCHAASILCWPNIMQKMIRLI